MKNETPTVRILARMFQYGAVLGGVAGALVLLTAEIIFGNYSQDLSLFWFCLALVYGAIGGTVMGGIAGLSAGFMMSIITELGFRMVHHKRLYQMAMGLVTGVVVTLVFFGSNIWHFLVRMPFPDAGQTWSLTLMMSVVIAVYASQITARKYLIEINRRKEKATL